MFIIPIFHKLKEIEKLKTLDFGFWGGARAMKPVADLKAKVLLGAPRQWRLTLWLALRWQPREVSFHGPETNPSPPSSRRRDQS
jgi:hypothetical protein